MAVNTSRMLPMWISPEGEMPLDTTGGLPLSIASAACRSAQCLSESRFNVFISRRGRQSYRSDAPSRTKRLVGACATVVEEGAFHSYACMEIEAWRR